MFLSDIIIYPVKSLPGIHINDTRVENRGLVHDRRWMLIDEADTFITLRKHHEMLLFDLHIENNGFVVKHRESGDALDVPWSISEGRRLTATLWDDAVTVTEGKAEWNSWMSEKLGLPCRLVYMEDDVKRPVNPEWSRNNEIVSFADAYPLLVIGSASLADLNSKLDTKITMDRFRPNLVFEGGQPYEEFCWGKFTVGNVVLQGLKPCERCIITTLDPVTAVRGREPLLTLAKQKIDGKIVFGQHALVVNEGSISINDNIEVLHYKEYPYEPV